MILEDWGSKDDKDAELLGKQHDHLFTGVFKLWAQQSRAFYEHIIIWKDVCRRVIFRYLYTSTFINSFRCVDID